MSSIVRGSQIIYGWVEKGSKKGHQLVTKSPNVEDIDISFLDTHSLPASLDNTNFRECRRFFMLPDGKFAFNYIKNIGKDTYGREGALLSHFIIFDFENLKYIGKNFDLIDTLYLKGINSVNDLLKFKIGNDFLALPEINMEVEEDGLKKFPEGTTNEMIFPLLLSMFSGKKKLVLRKNDISDATETVTGLENLFPGAIWFTFSTYTYDIVSDHFVDIAVTNFDARIGPETYIINLDRSPSTLFFSRNGYWEKLETVKNDNSILWQFSILLEKYGKEILESMNSNIVEINQFNTMETMFEHYLKMLASTYFDFLVSGEMDMDAGINAVVNGMESKMILSRNEYLERIREIMKENPNKINLLISVYFENIKKYGEISEIATRIREIVSIIFQNSRDSSDSEKFASLFMADSKLYKNDIISGVIANEALNEKNIQKNVSIVLSLIPEVFEEWYKTKMKEKMTTGQLDKTLELMSGIKNASKQMYSLYYRVIEETLKRKPEELENFIGILEKYHKFMKEEDVNSICKILISDLSKSKIDESDEYIFRLEKIMSSSEFSNYARKEEKKEKRGLFGRRKE